MQTAQKISLPILSVPELLFQAILVHTRIVREFFICCKLNDVAAR